MFSTLNNVYNNSYNNTFARATMMTNACCVSLLIAAEHSVVCCGRLTRSRFMLWPKEAISALNYAGDVTVVGMLMMLLGARVIFDSDTSHRATMQDSS